jgi:Na+/H+ antiporter NhaD/arsenite permease-like protein
VIWLISYFTPFRLISFEGLAPAVDLNVILLLFAMMALVGVLKTTNVFPGRSTVCWYARAAARAARSPSSCGSPASCRRCSTTSPR